MSDYRSTPETLLLATGVFTCLRADANIAVIQATAELPEFGQFEFEANVPLIIEEHHQFMAISVTDTILTRRSKPISIFNMHNSLVKTAREVYAKRPKAKIPALIYAQLRGEFMAGQLVLEYASQLMKMLRRGEPILPVLCITIDQMNAELDKPITLDNLQHHLWCIVRTACCVLPVAKSIFLAHYTESTSLAIQFMLNSFESNGFQLSDSIRTNAEQNLARRLALHMHTRLEGK